MSRNVDAVMSKAMEANAAIRELKRLADENSLGLTLNGDGSMEFSDWLSSDCYGEGNSESFSVYEDGTVWQSSGC